MSFWSNTIYLKKKRTALSLLSDPDQPMHLLRLLWGKTVSAKLQAIASILRHFFVYPVFNRGRGWVCLEVFGEKVHVEIAQYVASFLDKKLEEFWKTTPNLRGARSKNSFFRGIAQGYREKVEATKQKGAALIALEKTLVSAASMAYPRLSSATLRYHQDESATKIGRKKGQNLNIHQGLQEKKRGGGLFLTGPLK